MNSNQPPLFGAPTNPNIHGAPLRYPGAKWALANTIAAHLPTHYHYIEPFFGSGAVFFTKTPSPHELINDLNGQVTNFFQVLRDNTDALLWAIETTPWSRNEYELSHQPTNNPIEAARRFATRTWQAHASDHSKQTGWRNRGPKQRAQGMSMRWRKVPSQLLGLVDRLRDAEIENRPALEVIARFSTPDTLIYADPPYLLSTRTQTLYRHEMGERDHVELLEVLNAHPGPVVLSGYSSSLYHHHLEHWRTVTLRPPKVEKGADRTEMLWVKPCTTATRST